MAISAMWFGALGDIHGDFEAAVRIMAGHPDVPFWVCVGDLADDVGNYQPVPVPLYWIKGNNENFDTIAIGAFPANLYYLPNGRTEVIRGVSVIGLGGTFAPTWYETPAADLPYPGKPVAVTPPGAVTRPPVRDDKRRHFVREDVESCQAAAAVDLFLSHEAPRPYLAGAGPRRNDAGKTPVNEVLAALKPRLHLFGHHHRFTEQDRQGCRSVGLDLASRSYLLIDAATFEYEKRP